MIFAHLPAGYLISQPLFQRFWQKFSKRQRYSLMLLCAFFAVAPDLDLVYFYLIDASNVHRKLPTHSPLPYIALFLVFFLIGKLRRSAYLQWVGGAVFLGATFGHLLLDTVNSGVMWLYPWSNKLYGWRGDFGEGLTFFGYRGASLLLLAEIIIIAVALFAFTKQFLQELRFLKYIGYAVSLFFLLGSFTALSFAKPHLFHAPYTFFADSDQDGIINAEDEDIDNDGISNDMDDDRDGDGVANREDFIAAAESLQGIFHDPFRGRFLNISKNLGMLTAGDVVTQALAQSGYFVSEEMSKDFSARPETYENGQFTPLALSQMEFWDKYGNYGYTEAKNNPQNDPLFYERLYNLVTLFANNNFLINQEERDPDDIWDNAMTIQARYWYYPPGDILFFAETIQDRPLENIRHLAVVVSCDPSGFGMCEAIESHPSSKLVHTIPLTELFFREGMPAFHARIWMPTSVINK